MSLNVSSIACDHEQNTLTLCVELVESLTKHRVSLVRCTTHGNSHHTHSIHNPGYHACPYRRQQAWWVQHFLIFSPKLLHPPLTLTPIRSRYQSRLQIPALVSRLSCRTLIHPPRLLPLGRLSRYLMHWTHTMTIRTRFRIQPCDLLQSNQESGV